MMNIKGWVGILVALPAGKINRQQAYCACVVMFGSEPKMPQLTRKLDRFGNLVSKIGRPLFQGRPQYILINTITMY